ncbi:VOC family protein [Streptomyces sp. HNM0574]|uniref:VOC family protein n=1 Tax=Streptomyces sp. HNM0574 TaxID=2714954 RepID=UPI00146A4AFB|nr:VOC family protein [Streptomyces sp. HNM0574]NLU70718.1 VOC family protein [Streptomyces sp. HNM0574]
MITRLGSLNEFCWMDLKTREVSRTAAFFADVLGWEFAEDEEDWRRAVRISADGHGIGGVSDLSAGIYPPGTPAHVAYYLAVEDVDRRTRAATDHGARLVVPPFDAGDQGRVATLLDPGGAAFSLWQPYGFAGWHHPPGVPGTPYRMVLACQQPERARQFYRATTGAPLAHADFVTAPRDASGPPQWELVLTVDAPPARARPVGDATWRLTSPEGLTFRLQLPGT